MASRWKPVISGLDTRLEGAAHVLRDRRLIVPPFQRSYAWDEPEVSEFWADLRTSLGDRTSYFLGPIVLTRPEDNRTVIIDGQQRLATTALLLAAIRDAFLRLGDEDSAAVLTRDYLYSKAIGATLPEPRLLLNLEDHEFFSRFLLETSIEASEKESHRLIQKAHAFLSSSLQSDVETRTNAPTSLLTDWIDYLETGAEVLSMTVNNDVNGYMIFETLNARGRELTVADLLRNHLFGLAGDELSQVREGWMSAVETLGSAHETAVFIAFLRHLWSSEYGATRERDLYRAMRREIRTPSAAASWTDRLARAARHYAALLDPLHEAWDDFGIPTDIIESLDRLGLEQNRPLLLAAMDEFPPDVLQELLRQVVIWSVRGLVVGGIGGGTNERYYASAAVAIRRKKATSVADISEILRPILPADDTFRNAFSTLRVVRNRLAQYLLQSLDNRLQDLPNPYLVSTESEGVVRITPVVPRRADTAEWTEFSPDDLQSLGTRLGNRALVNPELRMQVERDRSPARIQDILASGFAVNEGLRSNGAWSPAAIRARQSELADLAPTVWPLSGS